MDLLKGHIRKLEEAPGFGVWGLGVWGLRSLGALGVCAFWGLGCFAFFLFFLGGGGGLGLGLWGLGFKGV